MNHYSGENALILIHIYQSSWVHGGKVYGFGGFGHPPAEAEDDEEDKKVSSRLESDRHINQFEDYPSYMRVVLEYYGYTSRCWNNQVSLGNGSSIQARL